jgi:hypothetical protein
MPAPPNQPLPHCSRDLAAKSRALDASNRCLLWRKELYWVLQVPGGMQRALSVEPQRGNRQLLEEDKNESRDSLVAAKN